MANLSKENRKYLRFPVSFPVALEDREDTLSSICANISQKGIYLESSEKLHKGDVFCFNLSLTPSEQPVKMLGEVVWISKTGATDFNNHEIKGFGVRFLANMKNSLNINDGILKKDRWKPSPEKDSREFTPVVEHKA